ncbi:hypothetical protein FVE85_4216 [Porphyridium purpureum]|uniref:Uncharacterized protein n=1 Tax=Porphyridium purpureum TaxID=35688 RepID=A0A5J4YRW0_PORPP|nr:hypothetical protein FVE85_4216 [Porphyridium purpureum]|eukprot:POR9137..scf229_5
MRTSICEYAKLTALLKNVMEECYRLAGRRTAKSIRAIVLAELREKESSTAFEALNTSIAQQYTLAHFSPQLATCLFTDALDTHQAGTLTHMSRHDWELGIQDQRHTPLGFVS